MNEETRVWLERAEKDFNTGKNNLKIDETEASMFFCHQASEKALKALLIEKTHDYPFKHNLLDLASSLEIPERFLETFSFLNPVYTGVRYPDKPEHEIEPEKADEIVEMIGEFLKWTKRRLQA